MTDSNLLRLMESQAAGRCGLVTAAEMDRGAEAVSEKLRQLAQDGALRGAGYAQRTASAYPG